MTQLRMVKCSCHKHTLYTFLWTVVIEPCTHFRHHHTFHVLPFGRIWVMATGATPKRLHGISALTMLMSLGQVGILRKSAIEHAFHSHVRPWRRKELESIQDDEGFGVFERLKRFESLVQRALGEQLISPVHAAQLLHLLSLASNVKSGDHMADVRRHGQ